MFEHIIKNILVCGLGGVGGYFGGKIAHKIAQLNDEKYKIYFLTRGSHLEEINKKGLKLKTSDGEEIVCKPNLASDNLNNFPNPSKSGLFSASLDAAYLSRKYHESLPSRGRLSSEF